jgi:hypothetical protein
MKIKTIASNMTELHTDDAVILFSYETPVAALRKSDHEYLRTDLFWSQTTSRHINKWLHGVEAQTVSQDELYAMAR